MTGRRVLRRAPWTLSPDRREGTPPPARFITCKACRAKSPPSYIQAAPDAWAIAHTGETGHREFREVVTAHLRVSPARGNPLHVEGR